MDKSALLSALGVTAQNITVPELGGGVTVNFLPMTGKARDVFQKAIADGDQSISYFQAAIVLATVVDDSGAPLFTSDDIETLRASSSGGLTALAVIAMRLNGIGTQAQDEAAKN